MTANLDERRRRPRICTMILCEIRVGEEPAELVRIRDLSECGIKIATSRRLALGDRLRVRLPGAADWTLARVAWCSNGIAGLSFSRAVDLPGCIGDNAGDSATQAGRFAPPRRMVG